MFWEDPNGDCRHGRKFSQQLSYTGAIGNAKGLERDSLGSFVHALKQPSEVLFQIVPQTTLANLVLAWLKQSGHLDVSVLVVDACINHPNCDKPIKTTVAMTTGALALCIAWLRQERQETYQLQNLTDGASAVVDA